MQALLMTARLRSTCKFFIHMEHVDLLYLHVDVPVHHMEPPSHSQALNGHRARRVHTTTSFAIRVGSTATTSTGGFVFSTPAVGPGRLSDLIGPPARIEHTRQLFFLVHSTASHSKSSAAVTLDRLDSVNCNFDGGD